MLTIFERACLHNGLFLHDTEQEIENISRLLVSAAITRVGKIKKVTWLHLGYGYYFTILNFYINRKCSSGIVVITEKNHRLRIWPSTLALFRYSHMMMMYLKRSQLKKGGRNSLDHLKTYGRQASVKLGLTTKYLIKSKGL